MDLGPRWERGPLELLGEKAFEEHFMCSIHLAAKLSLVLESDACQGEDFLFGIARGEKSMQEKIMEIVTSDQTLCFLCDLTRFVRRK